MWRRTIDNDLDRERLSHSRALGADLAEWRLSQDHAEHVGYFGGVLGACPHADGVDRHWRHRAPDIHEFSEQCRARGCGALERSWTSLHGSDALHDLEHRRHWHRYRPMSPTRVAVAKLSVEQ